jgi:hypothetical protein
MILMDETITLRKAEIESITGYKRYKKQYEALEFLGIEFKPSYKDGFPLVYRKVFEQAMGYTSKPVKQESTFKPNYELLNQTSA